MINKNFDAIIVGSGLNGSWAAKELTEAGMNVALIDAGKILKKNFFKNKWIQDEYLDPYSYFLRLKSILSNKQTKNTALLYRANKKIFLNKNEYPYYSNSENFNLIRSRLVGGRGHVWGRVSPRYTDNEFQSKKNNGLGLDWPINLSKLEIFYDQIEFLLKLGWNKNHSSKMSKANIIKERNLNFLEQKLANITKKKWPDRIFDVKPVMEYEPGPLSPMLNIAIKTKNLTLYEKSIVTKINSYADGIAKGIELINTKNNKTQTLSADILVLAASPFETIKLLQLSHSEKHNKGFGNSSGLLGKYIFEHISSDYLGFLPDSLISKNYLNDLNPFIPNKDPHGFYIAPFKENERNNKNFKGNYQIQGAISDKQKSIYLLAFGEIAPSINNYVELDKKRKDKWGIPINRINFDWAPNDIKMWKDQNLKINQIISNFEDQLKVKIDRRDKLNYPQLGTAHECGGARMGTSLKNSIVNEYCRLWDSPNVLICDASIFPSIGYQNPANTSMAITLRACSNIVKVAKNSNDLKKN